MQITVKSPPVQVGFFHVLRLRSAQFPWIFSTTKVLLVCLLFPVENQWYTLCVVVYRAG